LWRRGFIFISFFVLYKGSSSIQCRYNNDNHNNNCVDDADIIADTFEHRGVITTKVLPPVEKTKNFLKNLRNHFYNSNAVI